MTNKKRLTKILLLALVLVSIILPSIIMPIHFRTRFSIDRELNITTVILIEKNDDFVKYKFQGSGTSSDPYIISNLNINTIKKCGIAIIQTTAYFRIENCSISATVFGFYIYAVATGTCFIKNNNIVVKSIFEEWEISYGIKIQYVNEFKIENNQINASPRDSYQKFGILANYCDNSIVINNTCQGCTHALALIYSNQCLVYNNTFTLNTYAINIDYCKAIQISNNNASLNNLYGIHVLRCYNIQINNNILIKNENRNLYIKLSRAITIIFNQLEHEAFNIGLIDAVSSIIHHNNFILEGAINPIAQNAIDTNHTNIWFDVNTLEGNYWSDLIWYLGCQYEIDGGTNTDPYPLKNPVEI